MLRVSKTLLCALGASAGLATRQNVIVGKSGTLASVVEQIGALIQGEDKSGVQSKAMDNLRVLAAITPGATGKLSEALTAVIAEIEKNVDSKIKAGFDATQIEVDKAISHLDEKTTFALAQKAAADTADQGWFECIDVEKSKRAAIEAAVTAEEAAKAATLTPCQQQTKRSLFESDPNAGGSAPGAFACDFSEGDNCDKNVEAFDEMVKKMLSDLDSDTQEAVDSWTDAKTACESAWATAHAQEKARIGATSAWNAQEQECQDLHLLRQQGMCNFGTALQHKCVKVGAYTDLIAEVNQVDGGEHSETDRAKEWGTTQSTKCMLEKVINGTDIDAKSLEACAPSPEDYAAAVGQLDRKEARFSTLTSETSFTCSEKTITFFNGETWNLPEGEATSEGYTAASYHPVVDLVENSSPFTFCRGK